MTAQARESLTIEVIFVCRAVFAVFFVVRHGVAVAFAQVFAITWFTVIWFDFVMFLYVVVLQSVEVGEKMSDVVFSMSDVVFST